MAKNACAILVANAIIASVGLWRVNDIITTRIEQTTKVVNTSTTEVVSNATNEVTNMVEKSIGPCVVALYRHFQEHQRGEEVETLPQACREFEPDTN